MRDVDGVVPDEEGMELANMKAVQQKAAEALASWRGTQSGIISMAP
jgi:hypothetical protein